MGRREILFSIPFLALASSAPLAVFASCVFLAAAGQSANLTAALQEFDQTVARLKAEFAALPVNSQDKNWVKQKLAHMVAVDQYMRTFPMGLHDRGYSKEEVESFWQLFRTRWEEIDRPNTADLKQLLALYEWFTISEFGPQADVDAWLLVQHADHDRAFQKHVLGILERLYRQGETRPSHYAYLYDRVAVGEKRPQKFGTQGKCLGAGQWEPDPIEDENQVDVRRAEFGLEPLADYKKRFQDICR